MLIRNIKPGNFRLLTYTTAVGTGNFQLQIIIDFEHGKVLIWPKAFTSTALEVWMAPENKNTRACCAF
jgi:hypothetical protein